MFLCKECGVPLGEQYFFFLLSRFPNLALPCQKNQKLDNLPSHSEAASGYTF